MNLEFCDERFNRPDGWAPYRCAQGFEQRHLHENHRMYCETRMRVECSSAAAAGEIAGEWTWWKHGVTSGFRRLDDGSSEQVLSPVWWYVTRIMLKVYPPVPLEHEDGVRIPITMSRHFKGAASFDLLTDPEPGWLTIRGRFHAVENHIPLIPIGLASKIHLRAEAGAYVPRGTGWCGLRERLNAPVRR
jgi:hypothetical protein